MAANSVLEWRSRVLVLLDGLIHAPRLAHAGVPAFWIASILDGGAPVSRGKPSRAESAHFVGSTFSPDGDPPHVTRLWSGFLDRGCGHSAPPVWVGRPGSGRWLAGLVGVECPGRFWDVCHGGLKPRCLRLRTGIGFSVASSSGCCAGVVDERLDSLESWLRGSRNLE